MFQSTPEGGAQESGTLHAARPASTRTTWESRHPTAARLDAMAPGVELAAELASASVADADGAALVEMVAGWERLVSWAAAAQATVVAEMVRRAGSSREAEFVPAEVAARLATSQRSAENTVDLAISLGHSPAVHDALAGGSLDVRKAVVLTRETAHLGLDAARSVQEAVLGDAPGQTAAQLRTAIRRAELTLDLAAAEKRHQRTRAERSVRLTPAPDSMAWLTAYLPADDAMRVMTGIDAIAGSADPQDPRGIDTRRADALVDVVARVLDSGIGPYGPLGTTQRRRPHLEVTASARSLVGLDQAPATLAGYGAIPASMARAIGSEATWRPVLVDARTGAMIGRAARSYRPTTGLVDDVLSRDVTCTFPGCRMPATRSDLDHLAPFDPDRPGEDQTRYDNLHALCRYHHRLKTHGRWRVTRDPVSGVTSWTAPTGHHYARDPVPTGPLDESPEQDGVNQAVQDGVNQAADAEPGNHGDPAVDAEPGNHGDPATGSDSDRRPPPF